MKITRLIIELREEAKALEDRKRALLEVLSLEFLLSATAEELMDEYLILANRNDFGNIWIGGERGMLWERWIEETYNERFTQR